MTDRFPLSLATHLRTVDFFDLALAPVAFMVADLCLVRWWQVRPVPLLASGLVAWVASLATRRRLARPSSQPGEPPLGHRALSIIGLVLGVLGFVFSAEVVAMLFLDPTFESQAGIRRLFVVGPVDLRAMETDGWLSVAPIAAIGAGLLAVAGWLRRHRA